MTTTALLTIRGRFTDRAARDAFIDAFNEWAGNPEIDCLFSRMDGPSDQPESDYEVTLS